VGTRDRKPRPRSSGYITPEGAQRLRAELSQLWTVERPRVTQEVADAAALGDRSENAEYIYGKRRLREIDRRIQQLSKRLESLEVLDARGGSSERVGFGAWVTLEDDEGRTVRYRLVGTDETQPEAGLISVESPIGSELLGKSEGDEVTVRRPIGPISFTIVKIEY
jgi:transcription elongation factor GreB